MIVFTCHQIGNSRDNWVRLTICRDGKLTRNELSIDLGRRLAERLCDRYGIPEIDRAGLFHGAPMVAQ
jgi:hypothetical protein